MIDIEISYTTGAKEIAETTPREIGMFSENDRTFPSKDAKLSLSFDNSMGQMIFGTDIDLIMAISLRNGLNQFIHEAEIAEQRAFEREVRRGFEK